MGEFKNMDDDDRQMIVDETAFMARDMMDELAVKFMWDVFMALINPDEKTKDRIINAIAKVAVDRIRDDLIKDSDEVDAEDFEFCSAISDEGIEQAFEKFSNNMKHQILADDFIQNVIEAMSTNIVRSSIDTIRLVDEEKPDE